MPGNGVSGLFGDVKIGGTQVSEVSKWDFTPKVNIPAYSSNKTGQFKRKVQGVKDGTGTIEGVWDPTILLFNSFDVGSAVTLQLFLTAAAFYQVPAIIENLKFVVDIDTGDFVRWTSAFQATGAWTNPGLGEIFESGPGGGMALTAEEQAKAGQKLQEAADSGALEDPHKVAAIIADLTQDTVQAMVARMVPKVTETVQAMVLAMSNQRRFKDLTPKEAREYAADTKRAA